MNLASILAAVAILAAGSLAADPPKAPGSGDPMFRQGRAHLADLDRRIARDTGNALLRHERLRNLYFLSVADDEWLAPAGQSLSWLERRNAIGSDLRNAYKGAFDVVRAKHALWPPAKLDFLKRAEPLLDSAAARSPDDIEVRYLRLMSCYYLPFFFGRSWSVKSDFDALARLLPSAGATLPPGLLATVSKFVLDKHGSLTPTQKAKLQATHEASLRKASESGTAS